MSQRIIPTLPPNPTNHPRVTMILTPYLSSIIRPSLYVKGLVVFMALLFFSGKIFAQNITWGTNVTISADSDVFTDGTLVYAYDWDNINATVNGIAFTGTSTQNGGSNVSISGFGSNYSGYTSVSTPFGNLSAAYQSILKGGEYALSSGITGTITLNNLTTGHVYAVQIWVNDPRASGSEAGRTETVYGANEVTLSYNVPPSPGGVGQYSIGVFTATGSSETFTILSNGTSGSTQLNALLVSDVTVTGYQPVNPAQPGPPPPPSAQWVHFGSNGTLVYYSDNLGNRLPDFSYAGYMEGGVPLPVLPVQETISPVAGDNTANIQNAINTISAYTPTNGYRGAVLLNPGIYTIAGTLSISASGVVLRGSGDNTNTGTVLVVTGTSRNVITVGGSGSWTQSGTSYSITNAYLPLGATNFGVNISGITWGTNVTVSGDSDVFNGGTLLYAYDWANNNVTVNGVAFTGTTSANPGNVSISGIGSNTGSYSSSSAPFSNLSAAYQDILKGGEYSSSTPTATMTLKNLTAGHTYAVQVWVSDPRGGGTIGRTEAFAGYNQVTLAYNVPPATGGVGQYSIGVFIATGSSQTFSFIGNSGGSTQINALLVSDVTGTGYQPVNPAASSLFYIGEDIVIQRPQTQPWINAIAMNTLTNPWTPGTGLQFERQITAVNGNQITVDAPICNPIETAWTTGLVYQVTDSGRIQNTGIENLCGVGQIADYPSNILNGTFISYQNMKNCWAHDVLMSGWGNGFSLNDKWCTVQDCIYTNPATGTSSAAPAAYTFGGSAAMSLFQRCTSYGGYYHIMVTQASTPGSDVFLNFNCFGTHNINMAADTEGDYTPYLAINNRGNDGSGQGWGAGFSVMYNCQVPQFQLEQPDTTTNEYNWVIGGIGSEASYSDEGTYDTLGTIVSPRSLYLEQLKERLGPAAVVNIGYQVFTLSASPSAQSVVQGTSVPFMVNITTNNYFSDTVALSIAGLPSGASAAFSPNSITGPGASALAITASNSLAPGNYPLTINAIDGNLTNSTAVNLSVIALTPPSFGPLQASGSNLIFSGTNGPANGTYYVLTTTNLVLPIAQWTILSTNVFNGSGGFSFTNLVPAGSQQYFLLRVP
jgi:hypothetical protein